LTRKIGRFEEAATMKRQELIIGIGILVVGWIIIILVFHYG